MLNSKVHKKFINEFVFINHFESSQIYEHFSQHGNTGINWKYITIIMGWQAAWSASKALLTLDAVVSMFVMYE